MDRQTETPTALMGDLAKLKDPRILRIFVSSPFRGMERERECLTSLYWPKLRSTLLSRGILLRVVHMRWGITSDMSRDHQTVAVCLREVDRSDIFVGLYGQRYGWHGQGDALLQRAIDKASHAFPWVARHRDRSVTELEYLRGHLNNPGHMPACFAFRDAKYDAKRRQEAMVVGDLKAEQAYTPDGEEGQRKLRDLKDRIAASEAYSIGVAMQCRDPEECAQFVYGCVQRYIDGDILVNMAGSLSAWERSQFAHQAFFKSKTGKYIGGERYYDALDEYVSRSGNAPPLVITGPTGSEKASLLGEWVRRREDCEGNSTQIVIGHFVTAEPKASNPRNLLERLIGNLEVKVFGRMVASTDMTSSDNESLIIKLDKQLTEIQNDEHKHKKVIIIVDMVEQILPEKAYKPLFMIPKLLPENLRIVLTTIMGSESAASALKVLTEDYKAPIIDIQPLCEQDKRDLCNILLDHHSKSLSSDQLNMIINSEKTSQAFFLHNLILELCISGKFRKLDEQIETFVNCKDVVALLVHILRRIEEEYSRADYDGNLVQDVLCAICLCNRGISELEFPMPQYMWTPIVYSLNHHIINRGGLLSFNFPEMKCAVESLFMHDIESRRKAARKVADIFLKPFKESMEKNLPQSKRAALELPHLIAESNDKYLLKMVLRDLQVFEVLSKSTPNQLLQHWQTLACSGAVIARTYLRSLDSHVADCYVAYEQNMDAQAFRNVISKKAKMLRDIRQWMEKSGLDDGVELIFQRESKLLSNMFSETKVERLENLCKLNFSRACFLADRRKYVEAFKLHKIVLHEKKILVRANVMNDKDLFTSYHALGFCSYKLNAHIATKQWYALALNLSIYDATKKEQLAWF